LHADAGILGGERDAVPRPALAPRGEICADALLAGVRVDIAVDGDCHVGAVDQVRVAGDAAIGGDHGHGLFSEVRILPVIPDFLGGRVRLGAA